MAKKNHIWVNDNNEENKFNQKIIFNKNEFEKFFEKEKFYFQKFIEITSSKKVSHICLSYESLYDTNMKKYLLSFIGVGKKSREVKLTSSLHVINIENVCERFTNKKEAQDYLKKIKKESWIYPR